MNASTPRHLFVTGVIMQHFPRIVLVFAALGWWTAGTARAEEPRPEQFDRTIAPLLAGHCLDCHGAAEQKGGLDLSTREGAIKGGDSGLGLVPGKPDKSYLWERIAADEMPPKHPLSAEQKTLLKNWIATGAKWGTSPIDPFRYTSSKRAGYDWWSLQPVKKPNLPNVQQADWCRNPIDVFVLAKLEANGLAPSPEADRRTLIRRLSFDLIGLPPTPEEVEEFLADVRPGAYERLVERLLASPHYGERWARHWMDVVRFGESQGFERDKLRENSWPYRDWLVRAFNEDLPYDEFTRLQLAGDVLLPNDPQALMATGFLVAGPYDEVGQSQQSAAMRAVVRQDELEDIVSVVGQTFLGLTVNCARCHDHKFDPISQQEYYQMTSALDGVRHGDRLLPPPEEKLNELQQQLATVNDQLQAIEQPARERILKAREIDHSQRELPEAYLSWDFRNSLDDRAGIVKGTLHEKAERTSTGLTVTGEGHLATEPITKTLKAKTLEAWVRLPDLKQQGGGVISLQTLDGGSFDAIVFGEREQGKWMAGSEGFRRTRSFEGSEESSMQFVHVAIVYAEDGSITGYRNGQPYGQPYKSDGPLTFEAGKAQLLFGLRHAPAGGNRLLKAEIERANLYDRALTAEEIAASAGTPSTYISEDQLNAQLTEEQRTLRRSLLTQRMRLRNDSQRWQNRTIYAVNPQPAKPTPILVRGNPAQPAAIVSPAGIASIQGLSADFQLPPEAPDPDRRRELADWISSDENPLFARTMVNRLWHYHFGQGLVGTPNDLGFNGGPPSHPELLEWLSAEIVRHRWSLKQIHRLMVTSATYRQSSQTRPEAMQLDASNQLLWRKSPVRLEAESLRDAMLLVSGELNTEMAGPGYRNFETFVRNSQFYIMQDRPGWEYQRRTLYRTWVRSGRSNLLDAFDCPDPSTKTPQRAVTTTPLQALSLMNNSFTLRMADHFAAQVEQEAGPEAASQIARAYARIYQREPSQQELAWLTEFTETHGLAATCRVLFNSNEFLILD